MSATVTPRWNAATLMRPRRWGVTSIVSAAVKRSAFAPLFGRGSGVRTHVSGSLGRAAKARLGSRVFIGKASAARLTAGVLADDAVEPALQAADQSEV